MTAWGGKGASLEVVAVRIAIIALLQFTQHQDFVMKDLNFSGKRLELALAVTMATTTALSGLAGWTGSMNGTGYGKATVTVSSPLPKTNVVSSAIMTGPSAAMIPTTGYSAGGPLPQGA